MRGDNHTTASMTEQPQGHSSTMGEGSTFGSNYEHGEARWSSKLTEAQVMEIRARYSDGEPLKSLATAFPQCSKVNLHHIINGRRWRYLLPASV